jgi:hypothetical protein
MHGVGTNPEEDCEMSGAAVYLSDAERKEREAMLRSLGVSFAKPNAQVIPLEERRRKPLGLAPAPGADDDASPRGCEPADSFSFHFADGKDQAYLANAVSAGFVYSYLDIIGGVIIELHNDDVDEINNLQDRLKRRFDDIESARRSEIAELRLALTEARCEIREMRAIQESARIASRGEAGLAGPRGIPGSQGPIGPRGEPGPQGEPAAMIAAWEPRVEQFQIVPVLSSGERGPPISLRPFFEMYDAQTGGGLGHLKAPIVRA